MFLVFKAIDKETGEPLPGIPFIIVSEYRRARLPSSPTARGDFPVTNEQGELRVVVTPGRQAYQVNFSFQGVLDMYDSSVSQRQMIGGKSGETVRVTFELTKRE